MGPKEQRSGDEGSDPVSQSLEDGARGETRTVGEQQKCCVTSSASKKGTAKMCQHA